MRHVQHHAAQLNYMLSRKLGSAPRGVRKDQIYIRLKFLFGWRLNTQLLGFKEDT